jgi:pullulanase
MVGNISNGSGCGNEFRTETFMGRKFVLDSLKFWTSYYGFDGYRFDLMGLIDFDTMRQVVKELRDIKPDILLYGEPWTAGATPIHSIITKGAQRHQGFSVFNDELRDALKGSVFMRTGKGFVQTEGHWHHDHVIQGILGSINTFAASPLESLNYVEVHDNNTLFDKLYFSLAEQDEFAPPDDYLLEKITAMHKLTLFILLMSYGIPVLHLGQDFLRTKSGDANSYMSGDAVNQIDWQRKKTFYETFAYYKTLIQIRKDFRLLRINSESDIREAIDFNWEHFPPGRDQGIAYVLDGGRRWGDSVDRLLILINPYQTEVTLHLRDHGWKKLLIGNEYFTEDHPSVEGSLTVPQLSGNVLFVG